ncbi:MAG: hypothetical protein P1U61_03710 [Legionellaceae bacterium]|nr:hypothetical protein [Legionellaceae bacterium]
MSDVDLIDVSRLVDGSVSAIEESIDAGEEAASSAEEAIALEVESVMDDLLENVVWRVGENSSEHAFDFDNCIGTYVGDKSTPQALIEADEALFWKDVRNIIHAETAGLPTDRRCVSSFSARQSKNTDDFNTAYNDSTSSFPIFDHIGQYLDACKDMFLLADVQDNLPGGTSYERAITPEYEGEHSDWFFDESKITITYAKVHRSSVCNPNGTARVTAYDDRFDILNAVHAFFSQHAYLLPSNSVLVLCQYEKGSGVFNWYEPIQGNDASLGIDYAYKQTLKKIGAYIDFFSTEDGGNRIPLGIQAIQSLQLEDLIYFLRTDPKSAALMMERRKAKYLAQKLAPSLGKMIFTPLTSDLSSDVQANLDGIEQVSADVSCGLDAMQMSKNT